MGFCISVCLCALHDENCWHSRIRSPHYGAFTLTETKTDAETDKKYPPYAYPPYKHMEDIFYRSRHRSWSLSV